MSAPMDPRLPGLAAALDVDGFLGLLRARLPECPAEVEILGGRIFDVQYAPGSKGIVLYQLKLREPGASRSRRQLLAVQALACDEAPAPPSRRALAQYEALDQGTLRTAFLPLPDVGLVASAFPLDPVLGSLVDAFDPDRMREALQELWRSRGTRVRRVRPRCLGYTPHARAALLYEVLAEDRRTGAPESRRLVAKIHAYKSASALFAGAWATWRAADLRVAVAPPVGCLPCMNLSLQEHVEGERLGDLAGTATFGRWVRETARSLALLHGLPIPVVSRRSPAKEIQVVERWSGVLAALRPEASDRVTRLRDRLAAELAARAHVGGPLHGDFHPANVLVGDDQVTLIDLDQMARGDPVLDAGRFLASLRVSALRIAGEPDALDDAREGFLDRYLSHAGEDAGRVRLFEAACLLTAAATGFRLQRENWEDSAAVLLGEAERALERARPATAAAVPRRRPGPDRRRWCRDATYVQAALQDAVQETYGATVSTCRVTSPRDGERDRRIRIRLLGRREGKRWRMTLEGVEMHSGRRLLDELAALRGSLADHPEAVRLPRAVAYLAPLELLVSEPAEGVPLAALVDDAAAGRAAAAGAGRALAGLHDAPLVPGRRRCLERELRSAERRITELGARRPDLAVRVDALWREAERCLRNADPTPAPTLRWLSPDTVLCQEGRITFARPEGLAAAPPLVAVAELLARLRARGITQACRPAAEAMAACLREAYRGARSAAEAELAMFERVALLRMAAQAAKRSEDATTDAIVDLAEAPLRGRSRRIDSGTTPRSRDARSSDGPPEEHGATRRLARVLARECRGATGIVGRAEEALVEALSRRGIEADALGEGISEGGMQAAREPLDTVVLYGVLERRSASEGRRLVREAWARLGPEGRLLVCVPNRDCPDAPSARQAFDRRRLRRLLRPLGRPKVVSSQPFRWLVMRVDARERPSPGVRERYRVIAERCHGSVLELGCGPGDLGRAIADRGHLVVGVDRNAEKIAQARARHPDLRFIAADILDLDLPDRFETVVLSEVLEHVPVSAGDEILARAWELVTPGGRLIVSVPNEDCVPHPHHVREFDAQSLSSLLEPYGPLRLVGEQPYRYLLAQVDRERGGGRKRR